MRQGNRDALHDIREIMLTLVRQDMLEVIKCRRGRSWGGGQEGRERVAALRI